MADTRRRSPRGNRRSAPGPARDSGLWHRPQLLNFLSDLMVLFATGALGYALILWIMTRPIFPLEELVLTETPKRVSVAQIENVARRALRGNFFTVDLDEAKATFERLPWVRRAQVRRVWPGSIELQLEEYTAAAYWHTVDSDEVRMLSPDGEVFNASASDDLPSLSGPAGSSVYLLTQYARFSETLAPMGRRLQSLALSARQAWQLKLDDGLVIQLGRDQPRSTVDERLARFVGKWPEAQEQLNMKVAAADLRYPGGFALRPEAPPKGVK